MKPRPDRTPPANGNACDCHDEDGQRGTSGVASAPNAACSPTTNAPAAIAASTAGQRPQRSSGGVIRAPNEPTPAHNPASNPPSNAAATPPRIFVVNCDATGSVVKSRIAIDGQLLGADNMAITSVTANTIHASRASTRCLTKPTMPTT